MAAKRRTPQETAAITIDTQRDIDAGSTVGAALKKNKISSGRFYTARKKLIAAGQWPAHLSPPKTGTNGHAAVTTPPAVFTRATEVSREIDSKGTVLVSSTFIGETLKRLEITRAELSEALGLPDTRLPYYLSKHKAPLWLKAACHGLLADQEIERATNRNLVVLYIPQEHAAALANLAQNLGGSIVAKGR